MLKFDINLVFTVINLFILFFIIWFFLFKPVKKIIAKRREEVEKQYADAKAAMDEAQSVKTQYTESIKGAEQEKAEIIKTGRTQAGAEYEKIIADAHREADDIISAARKEAETEKQQSMKAAKEEIADIVSEAAGKIAGTKNSAENDRALFDDFISKLGD